MKQISTHKVLLAGDSFEHCSEQAQRFFDQTTLVRYDCVKIDKKKSFSGLDAPFFEQISKAENHNHKIVQDLLSELKRAKICTMADLENLEQGYLSKTFHILAHFLDGFLGIDSYFYNLLDDSHWLTEPTATLIRKEPSHYRLLHLNCFATTVEEAGLLRQ